MTAFEIDLLTGRYVATAYNDRREAEWPPHPARFFSALVATWGEDGAARDPVEADALRWLEQQGPPLVACSDAERREVVTVFVPVNDLTVVAAEDEVMALEEATSARAAAEAALTSTDGRAKRAATAALTKAQKAEEKARTRLASALTLQTAPTARDLELAPMLLPDHRKRQARTFPSVAPTEPRFYMVWPDAAPPPGVRVALEQLASRVVRVGHSSSFVRCRLVESPPPATWVPAEEGTTILRVAGPGQLGRLEEEFSRHGSTEPRVLPCAFQRYARAATTVIEPVASSAFDDQWIVLRRVGGPLLPATRAVELCNALRGGLMKHADQPAPPVLSGHAEGGGPAERPHLAIVALPFVGSEHADGGVRGLALVLPRAINDEERRQVLRAVGSWEKQQRQRADGGPVVFDLTLGPAGVVELERVHPDDDVMATLQPRTWCGPSRTWVSATPIALDRNPGQLRSKATDPARRAREEANAAREAREVISRACERIGLPEPADVVVLPSVSMPGTHKAVAYPPFPQDTSRLRRVKVHALLRFERPVRGPILLGAGRYQGLGLFRPVREDEWQA